MNDSWFLNLIQTVKHNIKNKLDFLIEMLIFNKRMEEIPLWVV